MPDLRAMPTPRQPVGIELVDLLPEARCRFGAFSELSGFS